MQEIVRKNTEKVEECVKYCQIGSIMIIGTKFVVI